MNTRAKMTARFHELRRCGTYAEAERRLRMEYFHEPPSVHDAALSAGIGEWAREVRDKLADRLAKQGEVK
jgi:hypothetical protein